MKPAKTGSVAPGQKGPTVIADIQNEYTDLISKSWRRLSGNRAARNVFKRRHKNSERTYKKISRRSIRFLRHKLNTLESRQKQTPPVS